MAGVEPPKKTEGQRKETLRGRRFEGSLNLLALNDPFHTQIWVRELRS
ncbi:MAG: hypothetical protein QW794_01205 [Thermosphaera sp.]